MVVLLLNILMVIYQLMTIIINYIYIDSNIITITNGNYNINQLEVNQLQNDINNVLSNFSLSHEIYKIKLQLLISILLRYIIKTII